MTVIRVNIFDLSQTLMLSQEIWFKMNCFFAGGGAVTASEYTTLGRVTEYKYGAELGNVFRGNNPIKYLQNFGMSKKYYNFPGNVNVFIETFKTNTQIWMAIYLKRCLGILKI